jgi:hypothetical protein
MYRAELEKVINADQCQKYLGELLSEVSMQTNTTPRSILDTFNMIANGKGGFFWKPSIHGGTAEGRIENNSAIANITPFNEPFISKDRSDFIAMQNVLNILGEVLHHVGPNNAYHDPAMANATNAIRVRAGLEQPRFFPNKNYNDILDASGYWHSFVMGACKGRR